jgi:hypothetical protein
MLALLLIVLGIVVAVFVHYLLGILLLIVGIVLLFVPGVPYGFRGRRGP